MCGIVGFVGEANGVKFLIDGLSSGAIIINSNYLLIFNRT